MLDSECHPYINKVTKENHLSHTEIESEFDKLLINEEGKNPFSIDLTKHINTNFDLCEIISPFFNINPSKISKSLKSMKFYNSIFNTPNKLIRLAIFSGLKVSFLYNKLHGVFFNIQDNASCKNICKNIKTLYNNSIDKTPCMMDNFYTSLKENRPFHQRLNRNFK